MNVKIPNQPVFGNNRDNGVTYSIPICAGSLFPLSLENRLQVPVGSLFMKRVVIVEDQASDLRIAAELAESLGASQVDARTTASAAKLYLQSALEGKEPLPDLMVVDLDLGYESGFELLRFWHGNPKLSCIRLIVWTVMDGRQQEICRLFKVDAVVPKADGLVGLKRAIEPLAQAAS